VLQTLSPTTTVGVRGLQHVRNFIESEFITEKGSATAFIREDAVPSRITEDQHRRSDHSRPSTGSRSLRRAQALN